MPAVIKTIWGAFPISSSRKTTMRPSDERQALAAANRPRPVLAKVIAIDGCYVVAEVLIEATKHSLVEGLKIRGVRRCERDADLFARELMGDKR